MILVFDLDDTLIPSTECYELALKDIGLSHEDRDYKKAREAVKSTLGSDHPSSHSRLLYFKKYLELRGAFRSATLMSMMERYENALISHLEEKWNYENLIRELSQTHRLAIMTNETTRAQILKTRIIDPEGKYFAAIVTSEEVGAEKPDGRIFQEVRTRFSEVKETDFVMVGDSYTNDIAPALARGWRAILTTEYAQGKAKPGDYKVIDSLKDLKPLVSL